MLKLTAAAIAAMAALVVAHRVVSHPPPDAGRSLLTTPSPAPDLGRVPVAFVPNLGQWRHPARYVARIGAMTVFLEGDGFRFTLVERASAPDAPARGVAVRMGFIDAKPPNLVAGEPLPGRHHYFLGNDPTRWRSDVPLYRQVRYAGVKPGVDIVAREHEGHFEYDLLLQQGAELGSVEMSVDGVERLSLDRDGALVLDTVVGPLRMPAPRSWETDADDDRHAVCVSYVLRGERRFGFAAPTRHADRALVVDPGIVWSTYLGGASMEAANAIVLHPTGETTVAGDTRSPTFPTTLGAFDVTYAGGAAPLDGDAFVTKLSWDGARLEYSTFLGGFGQDRILGLALDPQGGAMVTGTTTSLDYPVTPGAYDTSHNGAADAFVTQLSPNGSWLGYSTFVGGGDIDEAHGIAVAANGAATIVGSTRSPGFPTTAGAFDPTPNGVSDAFVARLDVTGARLEYSTVLGGRIDDFAWAVTLDSQGGAAVAGQTSSADFPTTPGAFDRNFRLVTDAFVARLTPDGSRLVYSTLLGGWFPDAAAAIAIDAAGAVTVGGGTDSPDFPVTQNAFDPTHNGGTDAFVTKLNPAGSSLVYSTFLGGASDDWVRGLALDARDACTVVGSTLSGGFPTTPGAFNRTNSGWAGFITCLSPSGVDIVYSTFVGPNGNRAHAVAIDALGTASVTGIAGAGFPTTPGAYDRTHNGGDDVFVARLDLLPTGVTAFGRSSAGCAGPLAIGVASMPRVGNVGFGLTCGSAAPNAAGQLALAGAGLASPVIVLRTEVWVDPGPWFVPIPARSNQLGACDVAVPIPLVAALRGTQLYAQFFWAGPAAPWPCPRYGLSASAALEITIQP